MNCERAQLVLSAQMDGHRVPAREAESAAAHVAGCSRCQAFAEGSSRIRSAVRIRAAEPVPDLVEPIMAAVATETRRPAATRRLFAGSDERRSLARHRRPIAWTPVAAALIAGIVVGSVLVGGPWQRPEDRPIAAATVVRGVRAAAPAIESFRATYTIVERGFAPDADERRFEMEVAFLSPQRFRLEVRDRTDYPGRSWTPNDLTYIENVPATFVSGPSGCPGDLPSSICPRTRATVTRLSGFSAAAPLPADLVLPLATFSSTRGVEVIGDATVGGRDAVQVRLSFDRASPMFPFLRIGGSWRPFFQRDEVRLWLDATTWAPLRWVVTPSSSGERREWELRYGLPEEPADRSILDVRLVSSPPEPPDVSLFEIPGEVAPAAGSLEAAAGRLGYVPTVPTSPDGLELVSVVMPAEPAPVTPRSLVVFADGLDYLRVGERKDWTGPGPFGPVDPDAEQVSLPGGGVAYYEPAGEGFGRRLALHTPTEDVYLETNLSRERLLEIAASMPSPGRRLPRSWLERSSGGIDVERVPVADALAAAGLPPSLVDDLPGEYVVASAEVSSVGGEPAGVTLFLRQVEMDAAGEPLTLHVEPAGDLPPASSASRSEVRLAEGVVGRWAPARSLLEWVGQRGYHSLQGRLPMATLVALANAIADAEASADLDDEAGASA